MRLRLSDTHSRHRELRDLPAADIIDCSGDVSMAGNPKEVMDFIDRFGKLEKSLTPHDFTYHRSISPPLM